MPHFLQYTDTRFFYAGASYPEVPLLVDSNFRFVTPVCDYLRNLVLHEQLKNSSVKTYAQYIQLFWNYLEEFNLDYTQVSDKELLIWLNQQRKRGNKEYVIAARCDVVFDLYCWLEVNQYVQDMVRIPGHNEGTMFHPMLSSRRARPSRFRPSRYGVTSGIRPRALDGDSVQPTPTSDDLTKLYVVAENSRQPDLIDRNQLLIDWYGLTGVRRVEAQHLTVDQIPQWSLIDELREAGHAYELRIVKTKGGKPRHIGVLPHLLERTREWIEGPRAQIVARFKMNGAAYDEPNEIFLSWKTGRAMRSTAITNLFTSFFKKANIEGHGHRIRAYYLTNLLHAEVEAAMAMLISTGRSSASVDWELIIRKVAERAGHQNLESIRKYVTVLKKKYNRISGQDHFVTLDQMLKTKKRDLELLEHRIAKKKAELSAALLKETSQKK